MDTTKKSAGQIPKKIRTEKTELRKRIRALLAQMPGSVRVEASTRVNDLLSKQPCWKEAKSVLLYAPLPEEPDVWPLVTVALEQGKKVFLPRYILENKTYAVCPIVDLSGDLQIGQFGIREPAPHCQPVSISRLDFVLVPGVAYDLRGHRLGRGRGFYDQLLKVVPGRTCGIVFDEQIVETVPVEP